MAFDLTADDTAVLAQSYLFQGVQEEELSAMLPCLSPELRTYEKDEMVLRPGQRVSRIGLVLEGEVRLMREDFWGNRHIVALAEPADLFAESYAATADAVFDMAAQAASSCRILFLDIDKLLHMCTSACVFHARMINNMVSLLAAHNIALNRTLEHVTQRTLREKLLSYLHTESQRQHSRYFDIPFDRQELADYLNADRSALSNELSKMKREGIVDYQKNHFKLCAPMHHSA